MHSDKIEAIEAEVLIPTQTRSFLMKKLIAGLTAVVAIAIITTFAMSQPPGERGEGRGQEGRGQGGRGFGPPPNPILKALDTNDDHELSAKEIENATKSLDKLDKNEDGKLSRDELHPFGPGGPGGFGPPPGDGPDGRGRGREGRGAGDDRGADPSAFLDQIRSFDENKDGKVTKDELPERMYGLLDRHDSNEDGALDRKELEQIAEQFGAGGDRRREGRSGQGPGGDGPGGEGRGGPPSPERMVEHAMEFDADKDGKLSREELLKFAEEMASRRGPGGRGRRPDEGGEGQRERRPARPNAE